MDHTEQRKPEINDEICIQDEVINDIEARKAIGVERYGTTLQPFNRRKAVRDLYEELLDGAQYGKQVVIEWDYLIKCLNEIFNAPTLSTAHSIAYLALLQVGETPHERC